MKDEEFNLDAESELPFPAEAGWDNYDEDDSEDYDDDDDDEEDDGESHICEPDNWADGDALASAGWGTDEDYGYYGECETYE